MSYETSLAPDGRPMVQPTDRTAWRQWLEQNHQSSTGVWLVNYKLGAGRSRLTYDDIVEEALCFGWIDSKPNKLDAERSLLWCSPRRSRSAWSRPNKERVARLEAAGLMTEAGLNLVAAAKSGGTWSVLDEVENLLIPPDLLAAFDQYPGSEANWQRFNRTAKQGILEWILNARRPATRQQRIEETARLASENRPANQWHPRS